MPDMCPKVRVGNVAGCGAHQMTAICMRSVGLISTTCTRYPNVAAVGSGLAGMMSGVERGDQRV